ncbi:hypothetical protein [Cytobacillus gottheilii]|uniref:hypothetical protein n=1 Tax=Cytobacillus gottheilii TaxID=859144 RepID=UPI0009B93DEC|nr:hypothetical protein [Cytobacillus gottheilii]
MKMIRIVSIILVLSIIILFYVPFTFNPPGDTRMIIDHNTSTYIAPPCFEESGATNYLQETTYKEVKEKGYNSNSACSDELTAAQKLTLIEYLTSPNWDW